MKQEFWRYVVQDVVPSRVSRGVRPGSSGGEGACTALGQPVPSLTFPPGERFPCSWLQRLLSFTLLPSPADKTPAPWQPLLDTGSCCWVSPSTPLSRLNQPWCSSPGTQHQSRLGTQQSVLLRSHPRGLSHLL